MTAAAKSKEEYYDAKEEFISDDKIVKFDITKNIIYGIDAKKYLLKFSVKEFVMESEPWDYNRKIDDEKVKEIKEQVKVFDNETSPVWTVSLIFDKYTHVKKDELPKYLKILDGQHRWKVLCEMITSGEIDENKEIYAMCYCIDYCEGKNRNIATELFKKINNNTPLCIDDIPDTRVQEIIDRIIADEVLNPKKEGIKEGNANMKAHEPAIHKKELFNILNTHAKNFSHLSIDEVIVNIRLIRNKIMMAGYEKIYNKCEKHANYFEKAKSTDFWLGLKSSKPKKQTRGYSPEHWVLYINNPQEFGK
tara:strand:- start:32 stop:949 length:918 start_codon:yes stop_codon:yes gene_type:complete